MTTILDTPARQHTIAQLFALSPAELQSLADRDFNALVKLSIADATRRDTPAHVRPMLRAEGMREDWQDALGCAEATLQVAVERLDYEQDPRLARVERQLRAVRCSFHVAANKANKQRRHINKRADARPAEWTLSPRRIAAQWLRRVFRDEYIAAVEAQYAAAGCGEPLRKPKTRTDMFAQAISEGWIAPPDTAAAVRLLALGDEEFKRAVVCDARDQNERVAGLFHPFATGRWLEALVALMRDLVPVACASSEHVLGPLRVDLLELDEKDARRLLNARRFFTGLRQRRIECNRWARIWTSDVLRAREADPRVVAFRGAQRRALEALARSHPEDLARILAVLERADGSSPFGPGMGEHSYPPVRERMLLELFPGWEPAGQRVDSAAF